MVIELQLATIPQIEKTAYLGWLSQHNILIRGTSDNIFHDKQIVFKIRITDEFSFWEDDPFMECVIRDFYIRLTERNLH